MYTWQTRVTNSEAATHESWLVRFSPNALGFGLSNQQTNRGNFLPVVKQTSGTLQVICCVSGELEEFMSLFSMMVIHLDSLGFTWIYLCQFRLALTKFFLQC